MADDPVNQQKFAEDVMAAASAGNGEGFGNLGDPNGDFKMPSADEVWKLIEQMEGISEEERANIRESLFNPQAGATDEFLKRLVQPAAAHTSWDYIIFMSMIAIVIMIFALFGYKLLKSVTEKEQKRQEKQEKHKQKHSKKSKKAN